MFLLNKPFDIAYPEAVNELGRIFEGNFFKNNIGGFSPLEQLCETIWTHHINGEIESRNLEFTRILMLIENLREVEAFDARLLKQYIARVSSKRLDDYIGARFEINIATTLIRLKVGFETPDPPDFAINMNGVLVSLECGSVHLSNGKKGDLVYKVASAINSKAKKSYAVSKTALCIDYTNIYYFSMLNGLVDSNDEFINKLFAEADTALAKTNFGSVILFTYVFNHSIKRITSTYFRRDSQKIEPELLEFLDRYFPLGAGGRATFQMMEFG